MDNTYKKGKENIHFFIERLINEHSENVPTSVEMAFALSVGPCYAMFLRSNDENKDIDLTDMDVFFEKLYKDMDEMKEYRPYIKELLVVPYIRAKIDELYGTDALHPIIQKLIFDTVSHRTVTEAIRFAKNLM